jgi:hypothetical protein
MTKEEAVRIFKKYASKHYNYYSAGRDIFEAAWYSQFWNGKGNPGSHTKRDWMTDEIIEAFNWYLDGVGRDNGWGKDRDTKMIPVKEMDAIEREINEYCREREHKKWETDRKSREKREAKIQAQGKAFQEEMKVGDVWMVKFDDYWRERGILVMEIDPGSISGFYLDNVYKRIPADSPKKEGYLYTKPSKYQGVKVGDVWIDGMGEWDGKTFKRTRSYETKMAKFLKRKIENPVIKK